MTRRELIEMVHAELSPSGESGPQRVAEVIDLVFDAIAGALGDEGKYTHPGFGTFTVKTRNARPGRHPKTGAAIDVAESVTVSFKPAAELKGRIKR